MINFARYKLGTGPSGILEWFSGRDAVGNTVTKTGVITSKITPLGPREIAAAEKELGVKQGTLAALESLIGSSVSTYGPRTKYRNANETERAKQFKNDLKHMQWNSPDFAYSGMLTDEQRKQMEDRREHKKQDLVYAATYHPIRNKGQSEESFDKEVAERDKALESLKQTGWTKDEIKQLLRSYAKTRGNKEAVLNRIRGLNKLFKTQ
jgi:hypothetical protein